MIKQKKCKYCKELFTPKSSLQKPCFKSECISKFYQENKKKIEVKVKKEQDRKRKEIKEGLKSISKVIAETKPIFQRFIRLRDKEKPCISCGSFEGQPQGGHFKKAEIYTGVIFDERNCHKQCKKCNVFLGGNEANYRVNLVKRFSEEFVSELERYADETRNYKYTREELKEIKEKYQKKIKEYEKV